MLLDAWSLGLLSCSAVTLFLATISTINGVRVMRFWDSSSNSEIQIRLEEEIWLSSTLLEFGLVIQVLSVLMLIFAADHFATILIGAMCATGALTANAFGIPVLLCKLAAVFFSVIWIVLHRLDVCSEHYPLVKEKYLLLLVLLPLLTVDAVFLFLYLLNLEPEIITSCCGVIFGSQSEDGYNLLGAWPSRGLLTAFAAAAVLIVTCSFYLLRSGFLESRMNSLAVGLNTLAWCCFYPLSLVVITVVVSPYVYALPHHRCPFDLLKGEYHWIGFPLYVLLHGASLAGVSAGAAWLVRRKKGLAQHVEKYWIQALWVSLFCLVAFLIVGVWGPATYLLAGGER